MLKSNFVKNNNIHKIHSRLYNSLGFAVTVVLIQVHLRNAVRLSVKMAECACSSGTR